MMHGNGMMEGMPTMGGIGWIFMLLVWGFALVGILCTLRWFFSRRKPGGEQRPGLSPLDILKRRYARGEITEEEFKRMKRELE